MIKSLVFISCFLASGSAFAAKTKCQKDLGGRRTAMFLEDDDRSSRGRVRGSGGSGIYDEEMAGVGAHFYEGRDDRRVDEIDGRGYDGI